MSWKGRSDPPNGPPEPSGDEVPIELEGWEIGALADAMAEAFTTRPALEMAVVPLWKNLNLFVADRPLEETFPLIIRRASSESKIASLLRVLRRKNPGARRLAAFVADRLPQSVAQPAVNELADLLMTLPSPLERLQACVKSGVVGDLLRAESIQSPHDALERLAELRPLQDDPHPLALLARSIARGVENTAAHGDVAREIERWCGRVFGDASRAIPDGEAGPRESDGSSPRVRYLVIKIQEQGAYYVMKAWAMGDGIAEPQEIATLDTLASQPGSSRQKRRSKRELPGDVWGTLTAFVIDALKHRLFERKRHVHVEFVMAPDHFCLEVDELELTTKGGVRKPIGHRYCVSVRPDTRDEDGEANLEHRWATMLRWTAAKSSNGAGGGAEERPQHVAGRLDRRELNRVFRDWNHRFCLILTQPPTRVRELGEDLRDAGVPVALWPRRSTPDTETLERLAGDPAELREKVLLERQNGHKLTLFWDDFSRRPPGARSLESATRLPGKE